MSNEFAITENKVTKVVPRARFEMSSSIEEANWNKYYPYQLAILVAGPNGYEKKEVFTLPISPEDLSLMTPFAIQTTATLDGVVEQHSGAPFRIISFQGTTGVVNDPMVAEEGAGRALLSEIGAVFGGTVEAAKNTLTQAQGAVASFTGSPNRNKGNLYADGDEKKADALQHRTGYYQFRILQRFLESYVERKKSEENGKNLRLALLFWKDQACYLVTPQQFEVRRNASSPYEYRYTLSFKAWRRINPADLNGGASPDALNLATKGRKTALINQLKNGLDGARKTVKAAKRTLEAVYADVDDNVFGPMRQLSLLVKDTVGLAYSVVDFPAKFAQHCADEFVRNWDTFRTSFNRDDEQVKKLVKEMDRLNAEYRSTGIIPKMPEAFYGDFAAAAESVPAGSVATSPAAQRLMREELDKARSLKREDFDHFRNDTLRRIAEFSDRVGLGDEAANKLFGRATLPKERDATDDDVRALFALSEMAEMYAQMAAYEEDTAMSTLEYVAGLAHDGGIEFRVPNSKFAVPFPYGFSLEQLSLFYLKDAQRWHEIATLNNLREPYIDEEGFDYECIGNGDANLVPVASVENLYLGQTVTLYSNTVTPFRRRITNLRRVRDGFWLVQVDGKEDLDRLQKDEGASLHTFLPGTVNSQQVIYIPSDSLPGDEGAPVASVPGVEDIDSMLAVGGVDLLLTPDGDLAVTPDGDCRVAVGMTNIVQRVRIALATPKGSMLLHPEFGLEIQPGASNADLSPAELLAAAQVLFKSEPAITAVVAAGVQKDGPVTRLGLEVQVAGSSVTLPIGIDVRS